MEEPASRQQSYHGLYVFDPERLESDQNQHRGSTQSNTGSTDINISHSPSMSLLDQGPSGSAVPPPPPHTITQPAPPPLKSARPTPPPKPKVRKVPPPPPGWYPLSEYPERQKNENENEEQSNMPPSIPARRKSVKFKKKLSKDQISAPRDFKHLSHIGFDPDNGGFQFNADDRLQRFFNIVGISEHQLADKRTREFIYGFIEKNGGIEKAIEESQRFDALTPEKPGIMSPSLIPPPNSQVGISEQQQSDTPVQEFINDIIENKDEIEEDIEESHRFDAPAPEQPGLMSPTSIYPSISELGISDTPTQEFTYDIIENNGEIKQVVEESQPFDALTPEQPWPMSSTLNYQPNLEEYSPAWSHIIKKGDDEAIGGNTDDVTSFFNKNSGSSSSLPSISISAGNNRVSDVSKALSGDDDDDDWEYRMVDLDKAGVPVLAMYDYEGNDVDELSFTIGDIFEKLEDEDESGWCIGRKDGCIGLYPPNYVEECGMTI
ncbi:unnamed protein product [Meganyctiphanes norvegica]|uniref:SH3 domain-containing protein n=1 Tax=Meganyctiphanes norvegica TaxID=48144 RepID=A0AAV2RR27_MEGNR